MEEQRENNGRIGYIDIYRAIGIVAMIMGHIGFGKQEHPLFFQMH